jgi:hypothetical protein
MAFLQVKIKIRLERRCHESLFSHLIVADLDRTCSDRLSQNELFLGSSLPRIFPIILQLAPT